MTTSGLILVGEGFSPWTEKARWALDHHRIAYRYEEYTPLVSEPWLRLRARRSRGSISVPFLLGPAGFALGDSFSIAQEADRRGREEPLVPLDLMADVTAWNERAERLMRAGRARILEQTELRKDVQLESLPQELPLGIRRLLAPTVRVGTAHLRKKYAVRTVADEELEVELAAIRSTIARHPTSPLLGRFTLADIAIASALQAVRPHATEPQGLLPAQRAAWERGELAARWEDVLTWRDATVARRPRAAVT